MNKKEFSLSEYAEVIEEVLHSGGEFRLYPKGTSMLPLIHQGRDSVSLVRHEGRLKRGDIAFYRRTDGSFVLHRVMRSEETLTMCGDNQLELEKNVPHSAVIGKVARVFHGEECVSEGISYRLYVFLWRSFLIRRIFFKLRKILDKQ
ncbi:MAG: S24/S26 family peptidase [Oscillospiraceae bacterium]|nr:S24/S26 family peptidase [Oscillospiraceae bacterium]